MSRLRLLLFCLLALAIPLQGLAATTQLFCVGAAVHGTAAGQAATHGAAAVHAPSGHGAQASLQPQDSQPDCGLCADCCHGVAVHAASRGVASPAARCGTAMESACAISNHALRLPDKPPRA